MSNNTYALPTTAKEAVNRLEAGNKNYKADTLKHERQNQATRDEWLSTQEPWAVVLSCADSRVTPELVFDTGIGELFVLRVAGNIANTCTLASIEYAVAKTTNVQVIVVMGHEKCGAVTAAMDNKTAWPYSLNMLLAHITPPLRLAGEGATVEAVVKQNARYQAEELTKRSTIIADAVNAGKVQIVTAYYKLDGTVQW